MQTNNGNYLHKDGSFDVPSPSYCPLPDIFSTKQRSYSHNNTVMVLCILSNIIFKQEKGGFFGGDHIM